MMHRWEMIALRNDLERLSSWANNAVARGIYPDRDTALRAKALACAKRMVLTLPKSERTGNIEQDVMKVYHATQYNNRKVRVAKEEAVIEPLTRWQKVKKLFKRK